MDPNNQAPQHQQYPQQPMQQPAHEDPGQIFGILSLLMIIAGISPAGIVLGYIGRKKSREAGFSGALSNIGFIINIVISILVVLLIVGLLIILVVFGVTSAKQCKELGPGTHQLSNGSTINCRSSNSDSNSDMQSTYLINFRDVAA